MLADRKGGTMAGLDGKALGAMSALLVAAAAGACSSGAPADGAGSTAGNGGAKNQGGSNSVGTSVASSSIVTGTVGSGGAGGSGGTGGAGGMGGCNPPATAGSFWAQTASAYGDLSPVSMCQYRGDVLLVVNTAAV
jgi:hypothetical protein